ncbi:MAG: MFS transporter [Vicingaceae bacterium]
MKNKKALYLLLSANAISHFAQGISMLAIPWYFAKHLNASSTFSTIYAVATFVTLFWGLYAGTLIDRYPRKNIFLSICAISAIVLISVATLGFQLGSVPMLAVAFVFCFTLFNYNIHYPTLYAFGQEITEKHLYSKTNSLLEVMGQSTNVLSGAMAVMLIEGVNTEILGISINIEAWSIQRIFLMDGLTYLVAMTLIYFIKYIPTTKTQVSKEPIGKRLREGIKYLADRPLLFYFGNASFTVFIFVLIATHVLWPVYISEHLQASGDTYAITKVHYALGALLAGFFISKLFRKQNTVYSILVLMLLALVGFTTLAFSKNTYLLFAFAFGLGIANAGIRIQRITYLFNHIPNNIIGRTNSVFQSINILLRSIFIALFSLQFFNTGSNIRWSFAIAAAATIISLLPLLFHYRKLRKLKME